MEVNIQYGEAIRKTIKICEFSSHLYLYSTKLMCLWLQNVTKIPFRALVECMYPKISKFSVLLLKCQFKMIFFPWATSKKKKNNIIIFIKKKVERNFNVPLGLIIPLILAQGPCSC